MSNAQDNEKILAGAVEILNQIASNYSTPKTVKKNIADMLVDLNGKEYSISVRAANTVSALDDVTQDPNIPSYIRVSLWQVVSKLESIRERF